MKANFQLITIIVFIALAIIGVLVFSGAIPIGENKTPGVLGTVVLWGTAKSSTLASILEQFNTANPSIIVRYVQKGVESFDQDMLEALANGSGPDMFLSTESLAFHYHNKIFTIPYQSFSLNTFKNNLARVG